MNLATPHTLLLSLIFRPTYHRRWRLPSHGDPHALLPNLPLWAPWRQLRHSTNCNTPHTLLLKSPPPRIFSTKRETPPGELRLTSHPPEITKKMACCVRTLGRAATDPTERADRSEQQPRNTTALRKEISSTHVILPVHALSRAAK